MKDWNESTATAAGPGRAERDILERLAFESLKEQRRARRWGVFFKLFLAVYLLALLFLFTFDGGRAHRAGRAGGGHRTRG